MHKTNPTNQPKSPKSLVWRKHSNGMLKSCTSKDGKIGYGGETANFFFYTR